MFALEWHRLRRSLLVFLLAGGTAMAAPMPDLHGTIDGVEEAKIGTPCFDPDQPWGIHVSILNFHKKGNQPVAAAGPFTVQIEIMNGPKISSGVFKTISETFAEGIGAPGHVGVTIRLPKVVKHKELGVQRALRYTIDPPLPKGQVSEDDETNNVVIWESGEPLPIAPISDMNPQAPQDRMLQIMGTSALPGDTKHLRVQVKNAGTKTSKASVMFLSLHKPPTPGAPTGSTNNIDGHVTVEPLASGSMATVEIGASQSFVQPTSSGGSRPPVQPISASVPPGRKMIMTNSVKAGFFPRMKRTSTLVVSVPGQPGYKILIPFTLEISGAHEKIRFGSMAPPTGSGPIAIPGKK